MSANASTTQSMASNTPANSDKWAKYRASSPAPSSSQNATQPFSTNSETETQSSTQSDINSNSPLQHSPVSFDAGNSFSSATMSKNDSNAPDTDKWAKYRASDSDMTKSNSGFFSNLGHGITKGLLRAGTSALGSVARIGASGLEEEPEDKYLTRFAKTGTAPEEDNYNQLNPTKKEHQKTAENLIAPKYLSERAQGVGKHIESFLERALPSGVERAILSGGNPFVIGAGLLSDGLREAGYEKTALGIDLLAPTNIKKATDKAYALAKAVRPKGAIVNLNEALNPLKTGLKQAEELRNPDAYNFINRELRHLSKVLKSGKDPIISPAHPKPFTHFTADKLSKLSKMKSQDKAISLANREATIEETIDTAKALNKTISKLKYDKRFDKSEKALLEKILFNTSQGLKEAAYRVPGAEKFATLNRAADHAAETVFKNPGSVKLLYETIKNKPYYALAGWLHFIPGVNALALKAAAGTAGVLSAKSIITRIVKDPILRKHYFRAKAAASLGLVDIVDEELKTLYEESGADRAVQND